MYVSQKKSLEIVNIMIAEDVFKIFCKKPTPKNFMKLMNKAHRCVPKEVSSVDPQ